MKKFLGLICIIGSIVLGIALFKQQSENSSQENGNKITRRSAPIALFALGLRLLFSGGSGGAVSVPLPRRPGGRNLPPGDPGLRGGQDTFATNPAQLDLNFLHWLATKPSIIGLTVLFAGGAVGLLFLKWQLALVVVIAGAIALGRTRQEMRHKFRIGDVCPGVVLSAEKGLVAVLTDLKAATNIARPAIKILKQPLHRIKVYALQDGMRVATVADYYGDVNETTWKNFFPEVIPCSVHDEAENQRLIESISEAQWKALDQYLAQIPAPQPGLYRLWGGKVATDTGAAVPWLQRNWVRGALIGGACFGLLTLTMMGWAIRNKGRLGHSTTRQSTAPTTSSVASAAHQAARDVINFDGKVLTFTNTMGMVFKNIELLTAEPAFVTYRAQGKESRMALATVPVAVQEALGIPSDWHGYRAAFNAAEAKAPRSGDARSNRYPTPTSSAAYQPGQKIYARWAGSWIPGTIIEPVGGGMMYRLQLEDSRFPIPLVLATNLLRAR